jgi:hypothetical protein
VSEPVRSFPTVLVTTSLAAAVSELLRVKLCALRLAESEAAALSAAVLVNV